MIYLEAENAMNKKSIVIILIFIFIILLILICVSSRNEISNQIYDETDLEYFGRDLLKELEYKASGEEIEIANQILSYAREIAGGNITDDSKVFKHYSPYSYTDCKSVDLQVEMITCKINGEEGHLWVKTSYDKYDEKGDIISYGSVPISLWIIKKENNEWVVIDIKEPI